ncbi:MAG: hypothetical protein IJH12_04960 [Clostridia bacterium]|nr:hypothetical protein [Clostridia bacterium]
MKYEEMVIKLRNEYIHGKVSRKELFKLYKDIYSNDNVKTFENVISLLKQYEVITDYLNSYFMIVNKQLYKTKEEKELIKIDKIISKEYEDIKTIVWSTKILNEFTQHYSFNNLIVVETERYAIEMILMLLKEKLMKKYTIVTENMYKDNENMFLNDENVLIVKALNSRAPLEKDKNGILEPTIEKIMIDLYKDKLYERFQGKELEHIYSNIFENYSINLKKLYSYAKDRGDLEKYKKYLKKIKVLEKV